MSVNKTDNAHLGAKLLLRRHFLARYHPRGTARVLDCCQGQMVLWKRLHREFAPAEYLGVDLKPAPGRLTIDSVRLLERPGWAWNVIDIDTWGLPWRHWTAILSTAPPAPLTVFLTVGMAKAPGAGFGRLSHWMGGMLQMRFGRLKRPPTLGARLAYGLAGWLLCRPAQSGIRPVEIHEAFPSTNARYLGIHLAAPRSPSSAASPSRTP